MTSDTISGPGGQGDGPAGPSRRRLLAGAGVFGAGAVAGGLGGWFGHCGGGDSLAADTSAAVGDNGQTIPFYGTHQAGIATPAQDRLAFGSLNAVTGATAADIRDLLREWTRAAADMTAGRLVGQDTPPYAPPVDTGEAV